MLVTTGVNYPGWRASIDGGEPVPAETVNAIYRGVRVGPGEHTVVMEFRSAKFERGLLISGAALVALLALVVAPVVTRRLRRADREGSGGDGGGPAPA